MHPNEGNITNGQLSRKQSMAGDHSHQAASSTTASSGSASQQAFKRHRSKSLDSRAASQPVKDDQQNGFGIQEDLTSRKYVATSVQLLLLRLIMLACSTSNATASIS